MGMITDVRIAARINRFLVKAGREPLSKRQANTIFDHARELAFEVIESNPRGSLPKYVPEDPAHKCLMDFLTMNHLPWHAPFIPFRKERGIDVTHLLTPDPSFNERLESMYGEIPGHINREFTVPCRVNPDPLYIDPLVAGAKELQQFIADNIRFVVLPQNNRLMSARNQAKLRIMASPHDGGRVLEVDEKVFIDGVGYVVTLKGSGATRYARDQIERGYSFMLPASAHPIYEQTPRLRDMSFLGQLGILAKDKALPMVERTKILSGAGIDMAMILSLFEITHLPNNIGRLRSVAHYQQIGILKTFFGETVAPALMVRASKSNFRLLDLVEYPVPEKSARFVDHVMEEFRSFMKDPSLTINDYFIYLARKVLCQKMLMQKNSIIDSGSGWKNQASNISIFGEELDVENLRHISDFEEPYCPIDKVKTALMKYGQAINKVRESAIDLDIIEKIFQELSAQEHKRIELGEEKTWISQN